MIQTVHIKTIILSLNSITTSRGSSLIVQVMQTRVNGQTETGDPNEWDYHICAYGNVQMSHYILIGGSPAVFGKKELLLLV